MFLRVLLACAILHPLVANYLRKEPRRYDSFLSSTSIYASMEDFYASGARCRTVDLTDAEIAQQDRDANAYNVSVVDNHHPILIKVYFKVLTSSTGEGYLNNRTILKQIAVMNSRYSDTPFRFDLAGTVVVANDEWFTASPGSAAETAMKTRLRTGTYKDLNIYTTKQNDLTLGWTTLPGNVGSQYSFDGVVVNFKTLPADDNMFTPYNLGITAVHETGHWLGLRHTFNGGCMIDPKAGDLIPDTPAEASETYGCPAGRNSCPGTTGALAGNDPIHNYMDYSDDDCMNNFTYDQIQRMIKQWTLYRADKQ